VTGALVQRQVLLDTYTGTWGADDNGFSADVAFRVTPPIDHWLWFLAQLDGRLAPQAKVLWRPINYPAQGFGINSVLSMDESCEQARINGIASVLQTPPGTLHIISGYSQGAICAYLLAHEFLPGGAINRPDDIMMILNFGDPTCPPGFYPDGWGITRYEWDPALKPLLLSYNNPWDMYGRAPEDTYLHIGFLVMKQFKWDFMAMVKILLGMIQNDEFVDALVELLPPDTAGLVETVMELTGHNHDEAVALINTKKPVSGGILGAITKGINVGSLISSIPLMATGFATGFFGSLIGGQFGKIAGGLLGGGSGSGGTPEGWNKMGKTFAHLLQFGITNDHGMYNDFNHLNWDGMTAVDHAVQSINTFAAHL
jgi:hypothetical protein